MLRKLMKYELLSTGRLFLISYIALIIMSIVLRLWLPIQTNDKATEILAVVSVILYSAIIIAVIALTFVAVISRFAKNLLGGEGYLMHTLPAHSFQQIFSKLMIAIFWCFCSTIVVCISVFLLGTAGMNPFTLIRTGFTALQEQAIQYALATGHSLYGMLASIFVMVLMAGVSSILEIYAAIMIGQLFNKHRTLAAVIAYIVIQTILGTLASIFYLLNPASFLIGAGDGILGYGDIWRSVVEYTGLAVIFFFITDYLMRRRLNLE